MSQLLNGHSVTQPDPFASLAGRLIDPLDRERYATVVSFVRALPPSDDFRQLAELLGLLSLLGQRLPDAAAELLAELREQTSSAREYHEKVDQRLASMPQEISAGLDPVAIAAAMSESFRQQIVASGLQDATALLKSSVGDMQTLSGKFTAVAAPLTNQFKTVAATITDDLARLTAASIALQKHNARLLAQERESHWLSNGLVALILVLVGVLGGMQWQARQSSVVLTSIDAQLQRVQTQQPSSPATLPKRKNR